MTDYDLMGMSKGEWFMVVTWSWIAFLAAAFVNVGDPGDGIHAIGSGLWAVLMVQWVAVIVKDMVKQNREQA